MVTETVDLNHVLQWLNSFEFKALDDADKNIYISFESWIFTFHIMLMVNMWSYKRNF